MSATADRIEALERQVEQLLQRDAPPEITPSSVLPGGWPGPVAAGELIESAWGNAVATKIDFLRINVEQHDTLGALFSAGRASNTNVPVNTWGTAATVTIPSAAAGSYLALGIGQCGTLGQVGAFFELQITGAATLAVQRRDNTIENAGAVPVMEAFYWGGGNMTAGVMVYPYTAELQVWPGSHVVVFQTNI